GADFLFAEQFLRPRGDGLYPVGYRIPDALRTFARGKRAAVVDDVINAGSATRGTFADLVDAGARPVAVAALMILGPSAHRFALGEGVALERLADRANVVWAPS